MLLAYYCVWDLHESRTQEYLIHTPFKMRGFFGPGGQGAYWGRIQARVDHHAHARIRLDLLPKPIHDPSGKTYTKHFGLDGLGSNPTGQYLILLCHWPRPNWRSVPLVTGLIIGSMSKSFASPSQKRTGTVTTWQSASYSSFVADKK